MTKQKILDAILKYEELKVDEILDDLKKDLLQDIEEEIAKSEGKLDRFKLLKKFNSLSIRNNFFVEKPEGAEVFGYTNGSAAFLLKENFDFESQFKRTLRNTKDTALPLTSIMRVIPKEQGVKVSIDLPALRKEISLKKKVVTVKFIYEGEEVTKGINPELLYSLLQVFKRTEVSAVKDASEVTYSFCIRLGEEKGVIKESLLENLSYTPVCVSKEKHDN